MSNELTNTTGSALATPALSADVLAEIASLEGGITFDRVKIPAGGGITFEIPTGDPDAPDIARDITGVIVHHNSCSTLWLTPFDGSSQTPDCFSPDGKRGTVAETGEIRDCATCQYNAYGAEGRKACRNSHRLYIVREGETLPIVLDLPPSSLKGFNEYAVKRVLCKGKKLSDVLTKVTLKKATSRTGIAYSQCTFAIAGEVSGEQCAALAPVVALVKSTVGGASNE